ncbi:acyl-ACP thioesterase domain-containing protein [Streptococcus sp. CSL10205-OR2]|uniref:acyl-ACP thioesterase domain-containing protein n=1 Tax=Streptococcus sp. CSL10205-OR2 TaxID=2980558 RepID=UPI0021DB5E8D|nr:acyl-ACP thioesterase domain-containing protein [Streptococcus sp. CSL10205-OR2]MCU9533629.1 thioesterase [Streptococcus sp. CSL10205-OR2]
MGKKYKVSLRVPFYDVDINYNMKLSHLLARCLYISGLQSKELGVSDQRIFKEYRLVWVITDYDISINRLPSYNEQITIETEAISYNHYYCYRQFKIFDASSQLLLTIMASFVLIDYDTRKLRSVMDEIVAPYESSKTKKRLKGPKYLSLEEARETNLPITFFDYDLNGHITNSQYLNWFYDGLSFDFLKEYSPKQINLRYLKEITGEGQIISKVKLIDNTSYHEIEYNGTVHAQAIIEWRKNDL